MIADAIRRQLNRFLRACYRALNAKAMRRLEQQMNRPAQSYEQLIEELMAHGYRPDAFRLRAKAAAAARAMVQQQMQTITVRVPLDPKGRA